MSGENENATSQISPSRKTTFLGKYSSNAIKRRLEEIKVGQLVSGTVCFVKAYGVGVDIDTLYALLHISTISQLPVDHPDTVFNVNDTLKAIVVWIDREKRRVLLSTADLEVEAGDMLKSPSSVYEKAGEMAARYNANVVSKLQSP